MLMIIHDSEEWWGSICTLPYNKLCFEVISVNRSYGCLIKKDICISIMNKNTFIAWKIMDDFDE